MFTLVKSGTDCLWKSFSPPKCSVFWWGKRKRKKKWGKEFKIVYVVINVINLNLDVSLVNKTGAATKQQFLRDGACGTGWAACGRRSSQKKLDPTHSSHFQASCPSPPFPKGVRRKPAEVATWRNAHRSALTQLQHERNVPRKPGPPALCWKLIGRLTFWCCCASQKARVCRPGFEPFIIIFLDNSKA